MTKAVWLFCLVVLFGCSDRHTCRSSFKELFPGEPYNQHIGSGGSGDVSVFRLYRTGQLLICSHNMLGTKIHPLGAILPRHADTKCKPCLVEKADGGTTWSDKFREWKKNAR